jgi:hypothetical protein
MTQDLRCCKCNKTYSSRKWRWKGEISVTFMSFLFTFED